MLTRRKPLSKNTARTSVSIERLEPRELLVVNIAQFQPTFTDSTSGGTAGEVTDGIVSHESSWTSQDNANQHWAEVRLPTPYPVGSAHVYLGQPNLYSAASFDLQYHDGSSWQTITSVTGATSTDHNLVFPETVAATRFRVHTSVDSQLRVKELVLLPANGPAGYPMGTGVNLNLASQRAPTATSVEGTTYAVNAVDGYVSNDSSWVSENSAGPHRLTHALPNVQKVRSVHLYSGEVGPDRTIINPISDFSLQFENATSSFQAVPIASVSSGTISGGSVTGNTSGDLVINFRWPIDVKRIRINISQANATIREMVVLPAHTTSNAPGYPIGTSVKFESPPETKYDDFGDAWYRIVSRQNNRAIVADETGASQTVDATPEVERQYQLLYSYALDAYRIRSEDTGQALQVKNASLDSGAAIVEGPYSAAPHQLWRLEPTDGGHFQIVNVWSGMVMQTGGVYPNEVTQKPFDEAADPANRVEWRMVFNKFFFKKGIGSIGSAAAFNPSWTYNWGRSSDGSGELSDDVVHTPMQWGRWNLGTIHQDYDDWNAELKPSYLLGYNEPDGVNQANMSVEEGIELWPQLEAMDVPLLSPALTHNGHGRTWLTDFADQADALGFRQDYAGMHWYGAPNVNNILNYVNTIQNISNGRDVWITEFSPVDWSGGSGNWSEETNYSFILEFMYRADRQENLDKYALFPFIGGQPTTPWEKSNPRANSFIDVGGGELTPYGKAYASWDGQSDPEFETLYVIHNRAASHRLQNTGSAAVEKASIRVEDESAQWIIQDAGNDEVYMTSAVDGRRAKLEAGNIVMSDPGATGWGVRWKIQHDQYGWHNIVHSGSGNYLRLNRVNNGAGAPVSQTLDVVAPAAAASLSSTDWWFVKPYDAAINVSPDLVATSFDAASDHVLNGQTDVTFTVSNSGILPAAEFDTHVVWSANNILGDEDDVVVSGSEATFTGVDGLSSESQTISLQLDQSALYANAMTADAPGQSVGAVSADASRLFLVIDVTNTVTESNETNNSGVDHLIDSDDITYFPWDKNDNGTVEPLEAITSIQAIGTSDSASDFDGNGIVTPLEALSAVKRIGYVRAGVLSKQATTAAQLLALPTVVVDFPVVRFADAADKDDKSLFGTESEEFPVPVAVTDDTAEIDPEAFVRTEWLDVI